MNTSRASCALSFPSFAAFSRSRKSEDNSPETPNTPDFLFKIFTNWKISLSSFLARNSKIAGSISPERVPIGTPSSGVNPIDVSIDSPYLTALIEEPLPRWQTIIFISFTSFPKNSAVLLETKLWLVPWKP